MMNGCSFSMIGLDLFNLYILFSHFRPRDALVAIFPFVSFITYAYICTCKETIPSSSFTGSEMGRQNIFSVLRGAFWDDVALKVNAEGVTRTNTNKIRATMLQVFEWLSKTCNMLPQQNVALKITLCTLLHEATFNATMLR